MSVKVSFVMATFSLALLLCRTTTVSAFALKPTQRSSRFSFVVRNSAVSTTTTNTDATIFPVLSRIAGINWAGECRYVNANLQPAKNLKLVGGVRYDINGTSCTLSSFLTFPNGNTREVVMCGTRAGSSSLDTPDKAMQLDSTAEEGGPIYMILTELSPDTVLINEIEKESGKTIMTSSLSLVNGGTELVQVAHEVGGDPDNHIEGHQVWRLKQQPIEFDDFDVRGTTGR